ncbi:MULTISPECIES: ABC-three component system middle component 1 [Pseudomonas]|uniref:Uncharacterized protein n=1 Tax=Pseudomonas juntendi TaxID=2666183 RepID=A0A7W2Q9U4_9PSED|nr:MULTISPECIES: ABC-three component system middle component 1 [Pseudomonas]MBA6098531.1 hypothetical protein [Pseudomonas juntendi]MBG6128048.1 hypothetical protein [Pseudomonas sp. M2]NSX19095.1 hypothetical protein [Pseudomonas putida]HDS1743923.1 hypothetical protein [Pseudomonas putida]
MIEISELVSAIQQRAQGRYEVCAPQAVDLPAPLAEMEFQTIQLKRVNQQGAGWRTVLIAAFPFELANIQGAFRWAADVRDMLPEPQTADLYMFLLIADVDTEDAARLETDDRFCRKVVAREQESVSSFLDRSFLASLAPAGSSDGITDPLLAALESLKKAHSWVEPHLSEWHGLLLSGRAGADIADALKRVTYGEEDFK